MKQKIKLIFPMILIILLSFALIFLSHFQSITIHPKHDFSPRNFHHRDKHLFNLIGQIGILIGAACFAWYIFKRNMKNTTKAIKEMAKLVYQYHAFLGWTALILVIIHGCYYLITDLSNRQNFTGIASVLILGCLIVYGYYFKRSKNQLTRKLHFVLSIIWGASIFLHGGRGLVILSGLFLLGLFGIISRFGLRKNQNQMKSQEAN